jgi:hypothetical protein
MGASVDLRHPYFNEFHQLGIEALGDPSLDSSEAFDAVVFPGEYV